MSPVVQIGTALLSAVAMEPASATIHRVIGHGVAWPIHRSHHDGPVRGPEANDIIPAVSALVTIAMFSIGVFNARFALMVPIAAGVTLYGAATSRSTTSTYTVVSGCSRLTFGGWNRSRPRISNITAQGRETGAYSPSVIRVSNTFSNGCHCRFIEGIEPGLSVWSVFPAGHSGRARNIAAKRSSSPGMSGPAG